MCMCIYMYVGTNVYAGAHTCPGTRSVDQVGVGLKFRDLLASGVLGLKA